MFAIMLAAALSCGDLCSPQAFSWYATLLADGGYGRLPREEAAFMIRERDGSLTLQPWTNLGVRRASFRGAVPARTIAVVHTHPAGEPNPSRHDHDEARRLGVPVIVVTPGGVVAAMGEGKEVLVIAGQ